MGLFGPPNIKKMKAKKDVQGLIKALGYQKDVFVRRDAAQALGLSGDARAVEPLVTALGDKNYYVRRDAAQALGKIGDTRAVKPLIATLGDEHGDVRIAVADALGQIGNARAVEPLIAALNDKNVSLRWHVAEALGEIGDGRAVDPLAAALKDENAVVQKSAAKGLKRLGWVPGKDEITALFHIALGESHRCVEIGKLAVKPLLDELDRQLREISRNREQQTIEPIPLLYSGDEGYKKRQDHLRRAKLDELASKEQEVRKVTAETLGQIGAAAVKPLIAVFKHESESVRRTAASVLVELYQSGRLDEEHRRLVLAQREKIQRDHVDEHTVNGHSDIDRSKTYHGPYFESSDCIHHDAKLTRHTDIAGIDFPV